MSFRSVKNTRQLQATPFCLPVSILFWWNISLKYNYISVAWEAKMLETVAWIIWFSLSKQLLKCVMRPLRNITTYLAQKETNVIAPQRNFILKNLSYSALLTISCEISNKTTDELLKRCTKITKGTARRPSEG